MKKPVPFTVVLEWYKDSTKHMEESTDITKHMEDQTCWCRWIMKE